jgi:hypothetical protein
MRERLLVLGALALLAPLMLLVGMAIEAWQQGISRGFWKEKH